MTLPRPLMEFALERSKEDVFNGNFSAYIRFLVLRDRKELAQANGNSHARK